MTMYDRIKQLRLEQNMSQEDLAFKVGYKGRSMIARIESGQVDISQSKVKAFATALNTSIDYLMDGARPLHPDVLKLLDEMVEDGEKRDEDREMKELWEKASPVARKAALAVLKSIAENGG